MKAQSYRFTLSLTLTLDEVCGQRHIPALYSRERDEAPIVQEAEWAPMAGLDQSGNSRPHWDSIPGLNSPQRNAIPTELSRPLYVQCIVYKCFIQLPNLSSKFRRISPAPDLPVPKYCVSTGVSAVSLMQISYMILLYNRCTSYHRMQRPEEGRRSCCRHPTGYKRYGGCWSVGGGEAGLGIARLGATMRAAPSAHRKAYSHTGQQCR